METEDEVVRDDDQPLLFNKSTRRRRSNIFSNFVQPCVVELLSTIIFVFVGTTSVQTGNGLLIAFAHGITIAILVLCFGEISGGHINPAVTVAVFVGSSFHFLKAILYIVSQLIGAVAGAALTRAVLSFPVMSEKLNMTLNMTVYESIDGGSHHLLPGLSVGQGILLEVLLTYFLCQSVLVSAVDRESPFAFLAIGLTVFADIAIGGNLSGASMNPARSFGPAVVFSDISLNPWMNHYVYWIGPLAGAILAAVVYRFFLASGKNQVIRALRWKAEEVINDDN